MFVVGIDPGLSRCGYAVLDASDRQAGLRALGVLATPADLEVPRRLALLFDDLRSLMDDFSPTVVAIERVFFQVNARTAIGVAQASGLAMATAVSAGADVVEYTPNQVKEAVAGWGSAGKREVHAMVQTLLGLQVPPKPADAADAAAVALCHLAHAPMRNRVAAEGRGAR